MTGPHIVRELATAGHDVTIFHRGKTPATRLDGVREILGDRTQLAGHRAAFERLQPDVVIDMLAFTREGAESFVSTFSGIAGRAVVISSADVYLAYGRLHHTEPGPVERVPLTEDSPLRLKVSLGGAAYDKPGVEAVLQSAGALPATIIRYPAVYGPGDRARRFFHYVKRMADARPAILLRESEKGFHWPHVYAENAAHAVVLAAINEAATGRIYNVSESPVPDRQERLLHLAQITGWQGSIRIIADAEFPEELEAERLRDVSGFVALPDYRQDYTLDSSRILAELGYHEVVAYDEGLRRTCEWLLANPPPIDASKFDYEAEDRLLASRTHP
jgi:nucleoside-diphosphate-sugar epimerase